MLFYLENMVTNLWFRFLKTIARYFSKITPLEISYRFNLPIKWKEDGKVAKRNWLMIAMWSVNNTVPSQQFCNVTLCHFYTLNKKSLSYKKSDAFRTLDWKKFVQKWNRWLAHPVTKWISTFLNFRFCIGTGKEQ